MSHLLPPHRIEPAKVCGPGTEAASRSEMEPGYLSWLSYSVLAALWLNLLNQLRVEWAINDQYSYGFAVPFLSLYLFARQWSREKTSAPAVDSQRSRFLMMAVAFVSAILLLPVRLIQEANPDWRIVSWGMAVIVVAFTLGMIGHREGFQRAKGVAFSVAFIFAAVPWPSQFENTVIQSLTRFDISVAASLLQWLGIPALQQGNVLGVGGSYVGFDEACSGIRSLQTTLMVSLFAGELYRFKKVRRLVVIVCAVILALLFNIGRILSLSLLSARQGNPVMERWHDSLGMIVMVALLAVVYWVATLLRPMTPGMGTSVQDSAVNRTGPQPWPRAFVIWLAAWVVFAEGVTEIWYRCHEVTGASGVGWTVQWPTRRGNFQERAIPKNIRTILRYSEGQHRVLQDENGAAWSVFYFRWAPGRSASVLAHSHRPEICLPAYGRQLEADCGERVYALDGIRFCFRHYLFRESGQPIHVWYCVRDDDSSEPNPSACFTGPANELNLLNRIKAVCRGRRNLGQRELEVILSGVKNTTEAENAFGVLLAGIVKY